MFTYFIIRSCFSFITCWSGALAVGGFESSYKTLFTYIARNVFVCSLLYFVRSMPINMMLDERKVKLVKSCLNSSEAISLCARIWSTDNSFLDIWNKYDVHIVSYLVIECHITLHISCIRCWKRLANYSIFYNVFYILCLCKINLFSYKMISASYILRE